jgi:predicted small metal-binding protein
VIWHSLCLEDVNRILEVMKRLVISIKRDHHIDDMSVSIIPGF